MKGIGVVQLLECEPELGDGLSEEDLAIASHALPVPTAVLKKGSWSSRSEPSEVGCLGYLIAKGLLVRRVEIAQVSSVELLGSGGTSPSPAAPASVELSYALAGAGAEVRGGGVRIAAAGVLVFLTCSAPAAGRFRHRELGRR